ncbi:hypothetical protein JHK82_053601 [Glycine max]|nr:hypothetical protein JHK82_053601 [Glycine max]
MEGDVFLVFSDNQTSTESDPGKKTLLRLHFSTAKWEASVGMSIHDNNSLGLFGETQKRKQQGHIYDIESIRFRGYNAITNFNIRLFYNIEAILKGQTEPGKRSKYILKLKWLKDSHRNKGIVPVEAMQPLNVLRNNNVENECKCYDNTKAPFEHKHAMELLPISTKILWMKGVLPERKKVDLCCVRFGREN